MDEEPGSPRGTDPAFSFIGITGSSFAKAAIVYDQERADVY